MTGRPVVPVLPPRPSQVDLRPLLRSLGHYPAPLPTATGWRRDVRRQAGGPVDVRTERPLEVVGAADGVQRSWLLERRDGRPVALHAVSAAVVHDRTAAAKDERLFLTASELDAGWCEALPGGLPVVELDAVSAQATIQRTAEIVDSVRRQIEHDVVAAAARDATAPVVVDGSIRDLGDIAGIVGVVKDATATQLLGDETDLRVLPAGHRSAPFQRHRDFAHQHTLHCAYLRLHTPGWSHDWSHGLIRIETLDPALLDPLAALCYRDRQHPNDGDPRWPVHLRSVRNTEEVLRARLPRLE